MFTFVFNNSAIDIDLDNYSGDITTSYFRKQYNENLPLQNTPKIQPEPILRLVVDRFSQVFNGKTGEDMMAIPIKHAQIVLLLKVTYYYFVVRSVFLLGHV